MMRTDWTMDFEILTEEKIRNFAIASDEPNLIHRDEAVAQGAGLLGIIALNTMIDNYASRAIATEVPGVRVIEKHVKYLNPLYAGSLPRVECKVVWKKMCLADVHITVLNGLECVAEGVCRLLLPPKEKKRADTVETMAI